MQLICSTNDHASVANVVNILVHCNSLCELWSAGILFDNTLGIEYHRECHNSERISGKVSE